MLKFSRKDFLDNVEASLIISGEVFGALCGKRDLGPNKLLHNLLPPKFARIIYTFVYAYILVYR